MKDELFKKIMREAEEENLGGSTGVDEGPGSWMKGMDLVRAMGIYEAVDKAYSMCTRAMDASGDEHAKNLFAEFEDTLSEIAMPLEMMFNELDESGKLDNRLAARWRAVH
jgi:hypothetical protein